MQFTLNKEQLFESIVSVEKTTVRNHTLPVLSCILIEVKDSKLFLTSTNLEVGIRLTINVTNVENGSVAVVANVLLQVISSLSSATIINFSVEKGYLLIESDEGVSKIALQEKEDFPILPEVKDGEEITLPSKGFREALSAVVYCASNSTIKPELSSVFVQLDGNVLTAVATDSFRLAEKKVILKKNVESISFLIPWKSVSDLLRVLENINEDVSLFINKHQFSININNTYLTLRLVAGSFPDYTQIIPKEFVTEATMLVFDFERVLKKAVAFRDQFNQTSLTIEPKNKKFVIHTKNESVGETTDNVSAVLEGDDLNISFNQKYLIESLRSISSDSIVVQFAGPSKPAVVKPVTNDNFLYLVMPMNR